MTQAKRPRSVKATSSTTDLSEGAPKLETPEDPAPAPEAEVKEEPALETREDSKDLTESLRESDLAPAPTTRAEFVEQLQDEPVKRIVVLAPVEDYGVGSPLAPRPDVFSPAPEERP